MNHTEAKDYIRRNAKQLFTPDKKGKGYICPICGSGSGKNGTGLTTKDGIHFTCWAGCFKNADIIEIVKKQYNLATDKEAFDKCYSLYRLDVENDKPKTEYHKQDRTEQKQETPPPPPEETPDYMQYYLACNKNLGKTKYHLERGISQETADLFLLGYEEHFTQGTGGKAWKALIIPTGNNSYVARNTDSRADAKDRYRKVGNSKLFNALALKTSHKPVIIVEGEIDALTILSLGGEAVALGSTANSSQLVELARKNKPEQPLIIALDNDKAGQKAGEELHKNLLEAGISSYRLNLYEYFGAKDANEAGLKDRESFPYLIQSLGTVAGIEAELKEEVKAEYLKENNTLSYLDQFKNNIAESINTPSIGTGFNNLDKILDVGLYEGLYIIGAISSLGKTTFCLQLVDQIAQAGQDVLVFSLEMARGELMAKSISRHSLLESFNLYQDVKYARTVRGITEGKRYKTYSDKTKKTIGQAIEAYSKYCNHIFISEGVGEIGVQAIRETIKRHILATGNRPVVLIDYIQILAPFTKDYARASDKQNTDKNVLELKKLCRDYKLPIIGISSFNRDNYTAPVNLASFKESGAIEYSSDVLIGLQYLGMDYVEGEGKEARLKRVRALLDEEAKNAEAGRSQTVQVKILKNRNGGRGEALLTYYPMFNYFMESQEEPESQEDTWKEAEGSYNAGADK